MGAFFSSGIDLDIKDADIGILPNFSNTVDCVCDLLNKYKGRIVIITGAGISSHQLPTFRSNNNSGLWEAFSPPILAKDNFYENPKPSWKLLSNVRNLQVSRILHPSLAHFVMHYLIRNGYVHSIITQNIDGLHNFKQDYEEKRIIELHGAVSDYGICEHCPINPTTGEKPKRHVDNLSILQSGECPVCEVCGHILKPPVAFFGDKIEPSKRERATESLMVFCDVLILVGTHCTVDPVLSMASEAKRNGSIIVEVNPTPTPADGLVNVQLSKSADEIFLEIGEKIMPDIDFEHLNLEKWDPA